MGSGEAAPATVVLQASTNGNGCGIAIVPLVMGDRRGVLEVTVVPKFWKRGAEVKVCLDESALGRPAPGSPPISIRAVVREKDFLVLSGERSLVERARGGLTGLRFACDEDGESEESVRRDATLFDEVLASEASSASPASAAGQHGAGDDPDDKPARDFLWRLVAPCSDLVKHSTEGQGDFGSFGGEFIAHIPELRPLVAQWLITESELALPRRRPHFRDERAELGAVRGRLVTEGLVRRAARHRAAIECEYTELDNDHPWQRLLRCAIRSAAAEEKGEKGENADNHGARFVARAQRLDRLLHDVALLPPREALAQIGRGALQRKNRHARDAVWLARSYLRAHFPAGPGDAVPGGKAVAVGLRFSTAKLFERLLGQAEVKIDGKKWNVFIPGGVSIREPQGTSKQPDLAVGSNESNVMAYLDAKYKANPGSLDAMPMSDQYQQYAYAVASGKPVLMVYIREPSHADENDEPAHENHQAACAIVDGKRHCPVRLGLTAVPFPGPKDKESAAKTVNGILSASLTTLLVDPCPTHPTT